VGFFLTNRLIDERVEIMQRLIMLQRVQQTQTHRLWNQALLNVLLRL